MNLRLILPILTASILLITVLRMESPSSDRMPRRTEVFSEDDIPQEGGPKRLEREWRMLRDPKTGRIPAGIRDLEMEWVKTIPFRGDDGITQVNSIMVANSYSPAGPSQNGGRTRGVAFDMRYNGTTNRVMLAGGINGGIFRSTDGGASWVFVHPVNEVRSLSCFAQDPRPGFQDTWYAGTGEGDGVSASLPAGFVVGNGLFKSTDNGATWTRLASTADDNPTSFTFFDIVHRLAVHPSNGHVYAAIHQRIVRSTDGGNTWSTVLNSPTSTSSDRGSTDILIDRTGARIFAAVSGRNPDRASAGIWTSATGNSGAWTRIAGGLNGQTDSVAGWRAYNNSSIGSDGYYTAGWARIVLALAPSNQNLLHVLVENGQRASAGQAEADLFRCDLSTTPATWSNRSAGLTAKLEDGTTVEDTWFEAQGGYNLSVAVHPTQPNLVYVGGVNLYRSTDGFATAANTTFIGGYESNTYNDPNYASHVDIHQIIFDPSSPNRMVVASDGGLAVTQNATATQISWGLFNNQYQTIQYYHVGMDPTPGSRTFYGGAQDNGTTFRDMSGIFGGILPDTNDQYILIGGDGGQAAMTAKNSQGRQFLFASAQNGYFFRMKLFPPFDNTTYTYVKPANAGEGEFITYYHLDEDNTDYLYYVSLDTLFRTGSSNTVTSTSGWTTLTGAAASINGSIFALATTRGSYTPNSHLFIGTDAGKVYRIKDPQNSAPTGPAADITPTGMTSGSVVTDIALNPRNQDTMMVVAANYGISSIFWTGNATAANPVWQVIEGNLTVPSVRSCAIVAKRTSVEYYAGTSVGLFSTTTLNGASTTWMREAGGPMTTAIINSIAYRWQDNTLLLGTHGNGMFAAYLGDAISGPTPVNEPIRNDPRFIRNVFPNPTKGPVNISTGGMTGIRSVRVRINNLSGQTVFERDMPYRNGTADLSGLPRGLYVMTITSPDRSHQYTRQIVRD